MVRLVIIGIVIAVAFTLYALVDAAMSDASRARGVPKPVWVVLVVVLPVIGGVLWFMIGKGSPAPARPARAPDDDPRFSGTRLSEADLDAHMRDLEDRLRELDDEVFPGESSAQGESGASNAGGRADTPPSAASDASEASDAADVDGADVDADPKDADTNGTGSSNSGPSNTDRP
ncbi:PLDc N-terminal domain-containing protein [Leucobacter sp. GX24907]